MGRLRSVRPPSLSLPVKGGRERGGGFPYSKCESACRCAVRHSPNELGILQLWSWRAVCSVGGARPGPSAKSRAPFRDSPIPHNFLPATEISSLPRGPYQHSRSPPSVILILILILTDLLSEDRGCMAWLQAFAKDGLSVGVESGLMFWCIRYSPPP
jgi:hypothetical protein